MNEQTLLTSPSPSCPPDAKPPDLNDTLSSTHGPKHEPISEPDSLVLKALSTDSANTPHKDSECNSILPDYANAILPPRIDTTLVASGAHFKYPSQSAPRPHMYQDTRDDQQILADIIRFLSL